MQEAKKTITVINLFAKPSTWCPEPYQILHFPNENRWNSAWLGLAAPLVMLPGRLWNEVLRVALRGRPGYALKHLLVHIPHTSFLWLRWGLAGEAYAIDATVKQMAGARYLLPHESLIATMNDFPQVAEVTPF